MRAIWRCPNIDECSAYVGCHPGTDKPLGTPAREELRELRMQCHTQFDPLWKSKQMKRGKAYVLMQRLLDLPEAQAHIGMLDHYQCELLLQKLAALKLSDQAF